MADYLKAGVDGTESSVFMFEGDRIHVSEGPYRYLLPEGADPIPLFSAPDPSDLTIDESGYLGEDVDNSEIDYEYVEMDDTVEEEPQTRVETFDDADDDFFEAEPPS